MRFILLACLATFAPMAAQAAVVLEAITPFYSQATGITQNSGRPGETRVFVTTKPGRLYAEDRATGVRTTLLDLRSQLVTDGEQGLVGLAFDPDYATNGYFYVHIHTRPDPAGPKYTEIRRYTDPTIVPGASPIIDSEARIFRTEQTETSVHKGGWIGFDKTGKLMISVGDGGQANDIPRNTGQDASDHLGSILRIDVHGDDFPADPNRNYAIPAGNLDKPGAAPEVFAYGLRNPYANSVAPDGKLIVADVGQGAREEVTIVDPASADRNLGWRILEGDIFTPEFGPAPIPDDYLAPAFVYDHAQGDRSIIGGYVYRGTAVPELIGRYVFGDQVSGRIWSIAYTGTDLVDATLRQIGTVSGLSSFGETVEGELLAIGFGYGTTSYAYAIRSDGVAPVPEPATWAMLIAGFGLIGGAMRRRIGVPAAA